MGVGGHFWDLLKPYARTEGFDFLRNKRVAVDLSLWIVQHETSIKTHTRNPHLRLTFFRTINLFSKFGAFPVFVVDGTPSSLKSQARILRFLRASGIDLSSLPVAEEGISVERNQAFQKCVHDCVELLELLGMPIVKATGEAEALCAQLNREHVVDACITSDSDAFLFGAECVIKNLHPNSREPFECYYMSDIEAGLGLKRNHLIAISLLVGNDHNLRGVQNIGLDTAVRFVKLFGDNEILDRLREIGGHLQDDCKVIGGFLPALCGNSPKMKPHCTICGHPGSKRAHLKFACDYCNSATSEGCKQKPAGFKCDCSSCDLDRKEKERKKHDNWQAKVCQKISMEKKFPNDEIIGIYLGKNQGCLPASDGSHISWGNPKTEMLVDFLSFHQHWEPSYIRQRMLPMLSTIFLREMMSNPSEVLLYGQYEFDCIQRVKIRYGRSCYVVNWKKATRALTNSSYSATGEEGIPESKELNNSNDDLFDDPEVSQIHVADGCWYLSTDEDMELVQAAFPEKVDQFSQETELKQLKSTKRSGSRLERTPENTESIPPRSVQLSITEFYRSSKLSCQSKMRENLAENSQNGPSLSKAAGTSGNFSKSARRRLLFN